MSDKQNNPAGTAAAEEKVPCNVCMKEVPLSEAKNVEASDYVLHFCGLECFDKWQHQAEADKE